MPRQLTLWLTALRKRWLGVVALLAYLTGAIGLPLPVSVRGASTAQQAVSGRVHTVAVHACGCPVEERQAGTCCCCSTHSGESSTGGCCGKPAPEPEPAVDDTDSNHLIWASGLWAWRCQGLQLLMDSEISLPPNAALTWTPTTLPPAWLAPSSESPSRLILPLPEPPPRRFWAKA
jgi:hypothetical protein